MSEGAATAAAAAVATAKMKKQARIASLDARFAARASATASTSTPSTSVAVKSPSVRVKQQKALESKGHAAARDGVGGRGAGCDNDDASGRPSDPSTSLYAPLDASERAEVCTRASAAVATKEERKRIEDMVTSDLRDARRAYIEEYTRELLATRGEDVIGDEDDILRAKLSRDKALLLDNATKTLDHGQSRAKALKERFAKANAARLSRTSLRKRGFYGVPKEKCTWSALAMLRAHWDKYAKGLIKDVKREEAKRRLTRGIDLHGCVVKVVRHSRTPDVVGREGCVAFVGGRFLWLVPRRVDAPTLQVLIDGGTFEFVVNEYVVKLNHEDILAAMPSS